jgi:hypothetical protein
MIMISRITSEFVWKCMFLKMQRKQMQRLLKKFKWHLNISIMMLLYCHNWKMIEVKCSPNELKFYMGCN